jgi:murein DD-endopeptidase MepM/ murein hydrolase activator NlpD
VRPGRAAFAAAVAVVLAGSLLGECPAPVLRLEAATRARQGAIVLVVLRSNRPLSSATLSDGTREIAMERAADGKAFRALLGVDFESRAGVRRLTATARDECGVEATATRELKIVPARFPEQKLKVDPAYVEPPEGERERIASDREKVARIWAASDTERLWAAAFVLPVPGTTPGGYGARRVFNGQPRSRHDGVDMAASSGTVVTAPAPGRVALAENLYFSGGTVILDHGGGLFTTYFHLSAIDVKPGELVAAGQRVGAVGATGRATGPHLHWGAKLHSARVNPLDLLRLPSEPAAATRN